MQRGTPGRAAGAAVTQGSRRSNAVALTFDDGPVDRTPEVVRILDEHRAKGTFFVVGERVRGREDLVQRMARAGHEIANHSFHHLHYPSHADVRATSELIRGVTGKAPRGYRAPFGAIDAPTARAAGAAGMDTVSWDVDSEDTLPVYVGLEPRQVYRNVVAGVRGGSIVLMHDGTPWSRAVEALPAIVATLVGHGYRLVTVSELLSEARADAEAGRARSRRRRLAASGPVERPATSVPAGWDPPASPISAEDLAALEPARVVALLDGWDPDARGPEGEEGFMPLLSARVSAEPSAFARLADPLAGGDPRFLAAVLGGLLRAVEEGTALDWSAALGLAEAAVTAGAPRSPQADGESLGSAEAAPRQAGRLLDLGLARDLIPYELDDRVWAGVEALGRDSAGDAVKAQAVRAAIRYAARAKARAGPGFSLERLPAARGFLDDHLDPEREDSPAVREVYGAMLAPLASVDETWLRARIPVILPTAPRLAAMRRAAWEAHLQWGAPNRRTAWDGRAVARSPAGRLFDVLEPHYRIAAEELPSRRLAPGSGPDYAARALARHVAILFAANLLGPYDDGVIGALLDRAGVDDLAYFVRFVGLLTDRDDGDLDESARRRLVELWTLVEQRLATREPNEWRTAAASFGFWYQTGALPSDWADERLLALLRGGCAVESEFRVFARLAERAGVDAGRAVEAATRQLDLAGDDWAMVTVRGALRTVIDAGLASPDGQAREGALALERRMQARTAARLDPPPAR